MHASKRAGRESERLTLRPSLCVNQRPPVTRGARRPGSAGGTCGPACPPRSPGPEHTGAGEGETSHARCFISGRTKRQPGSSGSRQKLKTTLFARNIHAREAPSPGDGGAVALTRNAGGRRPRALHGFTVAASLSLQELRLLRRGGTGFLCLFTDGSSLNLSSGRFLSAHYVPAPCCAAQCDLQVNNMKQLFIDVEQQATQVCDYQDGRKNKP
ncbi:uncharacterized protein LOC116659352 isoform X2 [Camelus ferus]|uniref:Uncharacterized protein LOC116659352 isoform X2 n=1 Tax=Camelus ferus TaxID=419612 RepID=A0A8B8RZ17_CAMFR|nr:uncharacterized protein LOC116659352 isoform X2 [Camelus ferus]